MQPTTRRKFLGAGLALGMLAGAGWGYRKFRSLGPDETVRLDLGVTRIASFESAQPERRHFGTLEFRSGLALSSQARGFGGLSALWRDPERPRIVCVSDQGEWLTAKLRYEEGHLAGIRDVELSPVLGPQGAPLRKSGDHDCESLAIEGGVAFVGIERTHKVLRFAWAQGGVHAHGEPIEVPPELKKQPRNRGLEALCLAPAGHPLAGALIGIAEAPPDDDDKPSPGWVLTGPERFGFHIARSEDFNITDAVFLRSGELIVLERSYTPVRGPACRIRRIARDAIRPGAMLDGEVLLQAGKGFEVDNMEGIAVHRDPVTAQTILTLLSDDNFNPLQRTLLLEFALVG